MSVEFFASLKSNFNVSYTITSTSELEEKFEAEFEDEEFDADDFTYSLASDDGDGAVSRFFDSLNKITASMIDDYEIGEYDSILNGGDAYTQFFFLVDDLGYSGDDALDRYSDVQIYEGSIEDYAREFVSDNYDLPQNISMYFDYEKFANDLRIDGSVTEFEGSVIINANDF